MTDNLDEQRQTANVSVVYAERYDEEWPPESLPAFLIWLADKVALIPEEYRDEAEIEIDSASDGCDRYFPSIEVSYRRIETDDEVRNRLTEIGVRKSLITERERGQLAQLKAKYES